MKRKKKQKEKKKMKKEMNKKIYNNGLTDKFSFLITIKAQIIESTKERKRIAAICIFVSIH